MTWTKTCGMNEMNKLLYKDSDGVTRELTDCSLYQDKAGRYWLWSDQLQQNLAYKIKEKEDCFLEAISSLLFIIQLKDERIKGLKYIADLAQKFADQIKPDNEDE